MAIRTTRIDHSRTHLLFNAYMRNDFSFVLAVTDIDECMNPSLFLLLSKGMKRREAKLASKGSRIFFAVHPRPRHGGRGHVAKMWAYWRWKDRLSAKTIPETLTQNANVQGLYVVRNSEPPEPDYLYWINLILPFFKKNMRHFFFLDSAIKHDRSLLRGYCTVAKWESCKTDTRTSLWDARDCLSHATISFFFFHFATFHGEPTRHCCTTSIAWKHFNTQGTCGEDIILSRRFPPHWMALWWCITRTHGTTAIGDELDPIIAYRVCSAARSPHVGSKCLYSLQEQRRCQFISPSASFTWPIACFVEIQAWRETRLSIDAWWTLARQSHSLEWHKVGRILNVVQWIGIAIIWVANACDSLYK